MLSVQMRATAQLRQEGALLAFRTGMTEMLKFACGPFELDFSLSD